MHGVKDHPHASTASQRTHATFDARARFHADDRRGPSPLTLSSYCGFRKNFITHLRKLLEHQKYLAHTAFMPSVLNIHNESIDLDYAKKHAIAVGDHAEELLRLIAQEVKSLLLNFPDLKAGSLVAHDVQHGGLGYIRAPSALLAQFADYRLPYAKRHRRNTWLH